MVLRCRGSTVVPRNTTMHKAILHLFIMNSIMYTLKNLNASTTRLVLISCVRSSFAIVLMLHRHRKPVTSVFATKQNDTSLAPLLPLEDSTATSI